MEKRLSLIGAVLFSTLGSITSCQNENQESIDQYEITEVGTKEDQIIKYESIPFIIETVDTNKLYVYDGTFVGTPILFQGKNYFTKKQTELFAKKYSYTVSDLQDEASTCIGTSYRFYNKIENYYTLTVSLAHPENYSGRCGFILLGQFTDYLVKPKDTSKESFTIHVVTGPACLSFAKLPY